MGRPGKNFLKGELILDPDVRLPVSNIYQDKDGYPIMNIDGRPVYVHRWVMGAKPGDGKLIDHINRNKLDSRRNNLRFADATLNARNVSKSKKPTSSRYLGVSFHKASNKWIAQVRTKGQTLWSGTFTDEDEAGLEATIARQKYFKEELV